MSTAIPDLICVEAFEDLDGQILHKAIVHGRLVGVYHSTAEALRAADLYARAGVESVAVHHFNQEEISRHG